MSLLQTRAAGEMFGCEWAFDDGQATLIDLDIAHVLDYLADMPWKAQAAIHAAMAGLDEEPAGGRESLPKTFVAILDSILAPLVEQFVEDGGVL